MKIDRINQMAATPEAFIAACDTDYRGKVASMAEGIMSTAVERPIVLISGPSGSGKTTTARLLEKYLDDAGMETHVLSMDNYFHALTAEEKLLFAENKLDLESPLRLDSELLNEQLDALHEGKTVALPRYNFLTNEREYTGETLTLGKSELLILEGIHALNPAVISAEDFTTRIYVSVRTRIEHGEDALLHPSKIRLARRMIRDMRTRGRSFEDTVRLYDGVERGENLYIMPYKHRAHFDIDTFHPFEPCLYHRLLPENTNALAKEFPWAADLFSVLSQMTCIDPALVPDGSLIREFIGGSMFE